MKKEFAITDAFRYVYLIFDGGEKIWVRNLSILMVIGTRCLGNIIEKIAGAKTVQVIYTVPFGNFIMAQFRKGLKFTMKMRMVSIMNCRILWSCLYQNIKPIMLLRGINQGHCSHQQINAERRQPNGIVPQRVLRGTRSMAQKRGTLGYGTPVFAKSAINRLCLHIRNSLSFVMSIVNSRQCDGGRGFWFERVIGSHGYYQGNGVWGI